MANFEIVQLPTPAALAESVAVRWLDELAGRSSATPCNVAVSGGRVARDFFRAVATLTKSRGISLTGVHFFWADERWVPITDPESNFAEANQALFERIELPATQIHRIRTEETMEFALAEAEAELCRLAPLGGNGQPVLDWVFLGMGEDGHIASLFPDAGPEAVTNPAVYRAVVGAKPPPQRVTSGYPAIIAARRVWVLASGVGKEQALQDSLEADGKTPLGRVLGLRDATVVFTDIQLKTVQSGAC